MSKEIIKQYVKGHKKEIILVLGAGLIGVAVEKQMTNFRFGRIINKSKNVFKVSDGHYAVKDLGRLGNDLMKDLDMPGDIIFTNIVGLTK